jgi:hypothetical protein
MRASLVLFALALLAPAIVAQGQPAAGGGAVVVTLNGVDVRSAALTRDALGLDAGQPAALSVQLTAPPDATWEVRVVRVTLVAGSLGGASFPGLSRDLDVDSTVAPGETLVVNRTADLSALRPVGAGVFRAEVRVLDASGAELFQAPFFVRIAGNPLLTLAGATVAVLTAASGYGLWRLLRDVRELNEARKRHRRQEEAARDASRAGRLTEALGAGIDLTGGLEGVVGIVGGADAEAARLARGKPVAWTLTGLGVGGVAVSWSQALGLFPFDVADLLLAMAGGGVVLLTISLVVFGRARRALQAPR